MKYRAEEKYIMHFKSFFPKGLLLLLSIFANIGSFFCQRSKNDLKQLRTKISSELITLYDRFDGIYWVKTKPVALGTDPQILKLYLVFGIRDDNTLLPLHLVHQYRATDWLFIECVKYLLGKADDNQKRYASCTGSNRRNIIEANRIEEIIDVNVCYDTEIKNFLFDFVETKKTFVVRVEGQSRYSLFFWSRLFGAKFPDHIKLIIDTYKKFGGNI